MSWNGKGRGRSIDQPVGWVVIRRRGGWNAEPEVVRFHEKEAAAALDAGLAHMSDFDPPADETDLFTFHAVLPPPRPSTLPVELRSRSGELTRNRDESGMTRLVLQRWTDDRGVLVLEDQWIRFRQIERALKESPTWGDFEDGLPTGEFDSLSLWEINDGEHRYRRDGRLRYARFGRSESDRPDDRIIDASDVFYPGLVPGYEDGDYPSWMQNMLEDLPIAFLEEFGDQATSMVSGRWWEFPLSRVPEMIEALRDIGYDLVLASIDSL